jgi:TatA/E family protein of Tat protein translocase
MAGLGWQELVIVLVIIMIIFGAGKLPEIAKSLGQGVKEFREEAQAPVVPASSATTATGANLRADANGVAADVAEKVEEGAATVRAEAARAEETLRENAARSEATARDMI